MTIKSTWSEALVTKPEARAAKALHLLPALADPALALTTLDDPQETTMYAELVRLAVKSLSPETVLDVGCGTGMPTLAAARAGAPRVVGIDIVQRNVELAREAVRRAALERRVSIHHASWEDVVRGALSLENVDLLVANPPYVPNGEGSAVDGGPSGTRMLDAIIQNVPQATSGMALLFGSLSDPLAVLHRLAVQGFEVLDVRAQSVPFGRYTSRRATLSSLLQLRRSGQAWFCDIETMVGHAPYAYLTMGVIARRSARAATSSERVAARVKRTLADYQMYGPAILPAPGFASLMP
jgi:SAM-dependent methyltransferase